MLHKHLATELSMYIYIDSSVARCLCSMSLHIFIAHLAALVSHLRMGSVNIILILRQNLCNGSLHCFGIHVHCSTNLIVKWLRAGKAFRRNWSRDTDRYTYYNYVTHMIHMTPAHLTLVTPLPPMTTRLNTSQPRRAGFGTMQSKRNT